MANPAINQSCFDLAQRAAAALRAISDLRLLLSFSARARPPTLPALRAIVDAASSDTASALAFPPRLPISLSRSCDSFAARSFPRATAAGFFFLVTSAHYRATSPICLTYERSYATLILYLHWRAVTEWTFNFVKP